MTKHHEQTVADHLPILDYPRELYARAFSYRSCWGFLAFTIVASMSISALWAGNLATAAPHMFRIAFTVAGLAMVFATAILGFRIVMNANETTRLTTTGIETSGKFFRWSEVTRFAANGKDSSAVVQVFFTVRISPNITTNRMLFNAVPVARKEYGKLIELLTQELSSAYPNLQVGGYFWVET